MENHKQKPLPPLSLFPQEPSKKHCMVNQGKVFNPRSIHGNCVPLTVQTLWGKLPEGKMCIYIYYLYINVCVYVYIYKAGESQVKSVAAMIATLSALQKGRTRIGATKFCLGEDI